jgi:hypothetical protein
MAVGVCGRGCSLPGNQEVSTTSQNSTTTWGPGFQHRRLWGTFHIQPITISKTNLKLISFYDTVLAS